MPPAPRLTALQLRALEFVKEACDSKSQAQALLDAAEQEFRSRVIAASKIGCSLDQIASAAGISKTRVHQIVRSK